MALHPPRRLSLYSVELTRVCMCVICFDSRTSLIPKGDGRSRDRLLHRRWGHRRRREGRPSPFAWLENDWRRLGEGNGRCRAEKLRFNT